MEEERRFVVIVGRRRHRGLRGIRLLLGLEHRGLEAVDLVAGVVRRNLEEGHHILEEERHILVEVHHNLVAEVDNQPDNLVAADIPHSRVAEEDNLPDSHTAVSVATLCKFHTAQVFLAILHQKTTYNIPIISPH